uniref:PH domain-containing protein n=1 Tax=Macrostomum lignano TaxID=282301 RepID=A0A1I8HBZ6_9PLAT
VRLASNVDVKRRWLNLATQLTHEQAVWHRPSSDVPPSWQIDPTEGPSRVRVRLKRCHTGLAAKFFKQSAKWKATWDPAAGPLAFLFREDRLTEDASATLFQLHRNDKIRLNRRCLSVAASAETPGEFLIGERCMYFVGDDTVWDASQAQLPPDAAAELQLPKLAAAAWYDCQSLKLMPPVVAPPDLPAPASCRCFCACARRLLTTESSRRWLPTSIRRCSGASSSASSSRLGSASWLLPSSSATLISLLANFTAQLEAAASCPPSAWSMSVSRMPLFCLSGWQSLILLMPSALVLLAIELRPALPLPLPLSLALETRLTNSSVKQALYTLTDAVVGDAVSHGDRPAEDSAGQFHNHCPPGASRQSKRGAHGEAQQQGEADESHGLSPAGLNAGHEADDGEAADSSGDAPQSASWSFDEVKEVHLRRYELRDNALEIFLANGAAYLLAFQSPRDRDEVARVVDGLELDSRVRQLTVDEAQRQWVLQRPHAVPVFPWVLADYDSVELDLTQPATFRDLARPIGTQDDSAVARHRDKYEVLDRQYRELGPDHATPPYHYSSHYSNSGTVLHYLVRLPPYTQLFTVYQDRHFDLPDRTFHSIRTSWRLSSKLSDSDVKELIPEFFCLPEFFINSEELDFGVKQSGVRVDNVELPPWAADDPRRFVLIHRAALESPLVTEKLHKWIDLIFGYKQTGKAALSSVNLFHPYTYFGAIDLDQIDDPVRRRAIETMIKTYGQTPKQLFRSPHQPPVAAAPRSGRVPGAFGVRFGNYCGSPDCQAPPQVRCRDGASWGRPLVLKPSPVGPSAPEVLGLCPGTCALAGGQLLVGAADNVFRWRPAPTSASASAGAGQALGAPPPDWLGDRVTAAAACGWRVFCGLRSGLLRVFSVAASSTGSAAPASSSASGARGRAGGRIDWLGEAPVPLLGHRSAVTAAHACPEFALLATGDAAGRVLLWDTNQVAYVRCLRPSGPPVAALTASPTLADVAVLGQLTVYTANGALVGSVSSGGGGGGGDRITCAVYSSLPEGRFINCLAVGLSSGCVRRGTGRRHEEAAAAVCGRICLILPGAAFGTAASPEQVGDTDNEQQEDNGRCHPDADVQPSEGCVQAASTRSDHHKPSVRRRHGLPPGHRERLRHDPYAIKRAASPSSNSGHHSLLPLQNSGRSQTPRAALHSVPLEISEQVVMLQHCPDAQLAPGLNLQPCGSGHEHGTSSSSWFMPRLWPSSCATVTATLMALPAMSKSSMDEERVHAATVGELAELSQVTVQVSAISPSLQIPPEDPAHISFIADQHQLNELLSWLSHSRPSVHQQRGLTAANWPFSGGGDGRLCGQRAAPLGAPKFWQSVS